MKRYVLEVDKEIIEEVFGVSSDSETLFEPNYNVMPGHTMPIIIGAEKRDIVFSSWGLKLQDSEEKIHEIGYEQLLEDKSKVILEQEPCIIPISGFYKWKETVDDPLPFYLRVLSEDVTGLAGFCNSYKDDAGRIIHTFVVLTMPANALVEPLDDRMPVILNAKDHGRWLDGNAGDMINAGFSGNHLLPDMSVFRVPELVNDPSNNSKELMQPIPKLRNYDGADED